jgi:hypothetical protein
MNTSMMISLISTIGFIVGALIGLAFGAVQRAARRKNERRQADGMTSNAWMSMPGSMSRVAFLMIALVLVQVGCPLFFEDNIQWMVSAGVVLGYGWMLFQDFRKRTTPHTGR